MAQKGKIRELQEDLKMSRQAVAGLSKYCDKYKEDIKELECKVKILTIQNLSNLRELLIAFAEEMQSAGLNEMDNAEQMVDIYMKSNL